MTNIEDVKKGTTTIGLVCKEGVVMATEMRATMGTLIAHKTTQKLFKIDDNLKPGQSMTGKSAATLTSNILAGSRFYPYWVGLILGGIDREGNHVYALDMVGGAIPDDYVTTGSGSPYVYGVLEDHYEKGLSVSDGMDLAVG